MKKTLILLVSLLLLLCLSSCIAVKRELELSQDGANVRSVALYTPEHAYYEGDVHALLEENEPIAVLNPAQITEFLDALGSLPVEDEILLLPIPTDGGCDYAGYVVAVLYSDGGYDLFAEGGAYSYAVGKNGQGRHHYEFANYCGKTPWTEFIEEYFGQ